MYKTIQSCITMLRIARFLPRTCVRNVRNGSHLFTTFACKTKHNELNNFHRQRTGYPSQIKWFCATRNSLLSCWNCKYSYPSSTQGKTQFFCPSCKTVQEPQEDRTYFDIMDCKQTFDLDTKDLTDSFRKLQSQLHPDKFSLKSETEQNYSSLQSSIVNEAYQTLLKPLSRGNYLLNIQGLPTEEGEIVIDVDFLTNIMDMNETLESGSKEELSKLKYLNKENLEWCVQKASDAFRNDDLLTAKEILSKMRYYDNINEQIKEKLME